MSTEEKNIKPKISLVESPNYGKENKLSKIKRRLNGLVVSKIANTPFQFKLYPSYWHWYLKKENKDIFKTKSQSNARYIAQLPNYGAGIGHQLANWNSGLYFSRHFNLKFAHFPFSNNKWDSLLGFGENEVNAWDLKAGNIKVVNLPRFDSDNKEEVNMIGNIIASYKDEEILFCLEQDQGYMRQFETVETLSSKFFNSSYRKNDVLTASKENLNIAIHIRRRMKIETEEVWKSRGLDNEYYAKVLKHVLSLVKTEKPIQIYLFSQGNKDEFPEFEEFNNINFCMEMNAMDSFVEMSYADILISSKSSFSYKPALISKGIKICPQTFWHGYPDTSDFILANNEGEFDQEKLKKALQNYLY